VGLIDDDHFDEERCLALLRRTQFGRVALSLSAVPVVFPVRYTVQDQGIFMAVRVEQLAKALNGAVAALQADGYEEDSDKRWTALAIGPTQLLSPDTLSGGQPEPGAPWTGREIVHLSPQILSGRWIQDL